MWWGRVGVSSESFLNHVFDKETLSLARTSCGHGICRSCLQNTAKVVPWWQMVDIYQGSEFRHSFRVAASFATRDSDVLWITLPLQRITGPSQRNPLALAGVKSGTYRGKTQFLTEGCIRVRGKAFESERNGATGPHIIQSYVGLSFR